MESWPHERAVVVGKVDPANANNSTVNTDYVDMAKFHEALFIFQIGAIDSTIDCNVRESTNTSDGSGQTVPNKSATQIAGGNNNKIVMISVKSEDMGAGFRYLRGRLIVGNGTTNIVAAIALGMRPRFAPASDDKLAAVAQIVS
jgi:hypothetical protein